MPLSTSEREALIERIQKNAIKGRQMRFDSVNRLEQELLKVYKRGFKDIKAQIRDLEERMGGWTNTELHKYGRYQSLMRQIDKTIAEIGDEEATLTTNHLRESARDSYLHTTYLLGQAINVKVDYSLLNPKFIEEVVNFPFEGDMFVDRIGVNNKLLVKATRQEILRSAMEGNSIWEVGKNISNKIVKLGVYNATRIARTETMRVTYTMERKAWEKYGIKEVRYFATYDERTCPICSPDHDTIFQVGKERPLPRHPHCRCCYIEQIPDIEDFNNKETERIRSSANYQEWAGRWGLLNKTQSIHETAKLVGFTTSEEDGKLIANVLGVRYDINKKYAHYLEDFDRFNNVEELTDYLYKIDDIYMETGDRDLLELEHMLEEVIKVNKIRNNLRGRDKFKYALGMEDSTILGSETNIKGWLDNLTNKEKTALRRYTGQQSTVINQCLRQGRTPESDILDTIDAMTEAINRSPVAHNVIVFRGCGYNAFGVRDLNELVGTEFLDRGFMSTTLNPQATFGGGVKMQIKVPKGTRGSYIEDLSAMKSEKELLLQRDTRIKITEVIYDETRTPTIIGEVLNNAR